jgi:hypothetical protein
MTAIIRMPVEIFDDGTYKIYTESYKIDFSDLEDESELLSYLPEDSDDGEISVVEEEEDTSPPREPFIERITQILANEIKPRRNRVSTNTTFKNYSALRKSTMRFSRKNKEPIRINSGTEDVGLLEAKTELA